MKNQQDPYAGIDPAIFGVDAGGLSAADSLSQQ